MSEHPRTACLPDQSAPSPHSNPSLVEASTNTRRISPIARSIEMRGFLSTTPTLSNTSSQQDPNSMFNVSGYPVSKDVFEALYLGGPWPDSLTAIVDQLLDTKAMQDEDDLESQYYLADLMVDRMHLIPGHPSRDVMTDGCHQFLDETFVEGITAIEWYTRAHRAYCRVPNALTNEEIARAKLRIALQYNREHTAALLSKASQQGSN